MEQLYLHAVIAIARRWKLLLGVAVFAGAGSVVFQFLRPPAYEAEVILETANAMVGERHTFADMEGGGANTYTVSSSFANQIPDAEGPTVIKDLLQSTSVVGQLYEKLKGKNAFYKGQAPELVDFADWLTAEANVIDQTTRPVSYSPVLFLRSDGRSEEEARAIVDTWAHLALDVAQDAVRLRVEPITETLKILESEQKAALTAIASERTALETESGGPGLEAALQSVLRKLADSTSEAVVYPERATADATFQDQIKRLESERDDLEKRVAAYREKHDWLEIREKVARDNYTDVAANLVRAETAGRIALSRDAQGKLTVGVNLLVDHAYAKEKRGAFGKKDRVVAVTFVATVLAALCVVVVDVLVPWLRGVGKTS